MADQPDHNQSREETGQLERSLGFGEAFTIGVGTMIGAGIFIFPGLAAGEAGLAATVSFGIGAVIAIIVALSVSELATAIPKSGGTYYFVARGANRPAGAMVGIGLWWGLVFASAFYLVGFGMYLNKIAAEVGLNVTLEPKSVGMVSALLLSMVNILGTEKSGELQDIIVGALLTILGIFILYGTLQTTGAVGEAQIPETFAPFGALPVFTTAALVFTSYLGFAGIANMAGEIKDPDENLPRAMIGSVALVATMYVLTILVATGAYAPEQLSSLGETALVEVGREYVGAVGAVALLFSGLLATVSSANASLLGSSRSVFALSSDGILPEKASEVNESFGTPHISIVSAGVPIAAIIAVGKVEVLAEVASLLHLVLYGLMCLSAWRLRNRNPDWYNPSFRAPGHPVLPLVGAISCFGLIFFMKHTSQIVGAAVLLASLAWFYGYRWWSEPDADESPAGSDGGAAEPSEA